VFYRDKNRSLKILRPGSYQVIYGDKNMAAAKAGVRGVVDQTTNVEPEVRVTGTGSLMMLAEGLFSPKRTLPNSSPVATFGQQRTLASNL
jgi:hypothetical protein